MSRVRVNPYGPSNSARELATYLGAKRLITGSQSKFRGRPTDVVINWGIGKGNVGRARQINSLESVRLASNKLQTLRRLNSKGISIPASYTNTSYMHPEKLYMARTTLTGHSGRGIVVGTLESLPQAPLYVEYIDKVREYRVIATKDRVVDTKQKKKRSSPRDTDGEVIEDERIEHNEHVWNLDGGYIFARNDIVNPNGLGQLGIDAIVALGLDFGAVDIIEDAEGKLYVLEVNTAMGLEGTTLSLLGDAIQELIGGV